MRKNSVHRLKILPMLFLAIMSMFPVATYANQAVVSSAVDFDVLLNVDPAFGIQPTEFSRLVGGYLDTLISNGKNGNGNKTYRISTTAASIDPTDLTTWHLYDHYDPSWYPNEGAWRSSYATHRGLPTLPQIWNYFGGVTETQSGGNGSGTLTLDRMLFYKNARPSVQNADSLYGTNTNTVTWGNTARLREHIYAFKENMKPAIQFYGYGTEGFLDFLYYPASASSNKSVKFDIDASNVQPHTLEYAGFLVNAGVSSGSMSGYMIVFTYGPAGASGGTPANALNGVFLYHLNGVNVNTLHSSGLSGVPYTNISIPEFSQSGADFWKKSHIELEVTSSSIKAKIQKMNDSTGVLEGSPVTLMDVSLPANTGYGGFGPFIDYSTHSCTNTSSYRFSNLEMSFAEPSTGGSVLEAYQHADFHTGSTQTFFVNITNPAQSNYAKAAGDSDLAFLSMIKNDKTVLITDETKSSDTTSDVFTKTYLGANAKDINNLSDVDFDATGLTASSPSENAAAKTAWLIYHTLYSDNEGQAPTPQNSVVAGIDLRERNLATSPQVNQVLKQLIQAEGLKIYLDGSRSVNAGAYVPQYTIKKPGDTESSALIALTDEDSGGRYFTVDNSPSWPAGEYTIGMQYVVDAGVVSIPATTKLWLLNDIAPPSLSVTLSTTNMTGALLFSNTPSTGTFTFTSDLASYAMIVSTSADRPAEDPAVNARTSIAQGSVSAIPTFTVPGPGTYYAHAYLYDAAGNLGYARSDPLVITKKNQALSGRTSYVLEYGIDSQIIFDAENTTVFASEDVRPSPLVAYEKSSGVSVSLDNNTVTPLKLGKSTIRASASSTATHLAASMLIEVDVVNPLSVRLIATGFDTAGGITVKPTKQEGGYGVLSQTLQYRKVGDTNWIDIPEQGWQLDGGYQMDFSLLQPKAEYEMRVTAVDNRPLTPRSVSDTLRFRVPGDDRNFASITVSVEAIEDYAFVKDQEYVLSVYNGSTVLMSGVHYVSQVDIDNKSFNMTFDNLPDGNLTVVLIRPDGNRINDMATIKDGKPMVLQMLLGNAIRSTWVRILSEKTPPVNVDGLVELYEWFKKNPAPSEILGLTEHDCLTAFSDGSVSLIELRAAGVDVKAPGSLAGKVDRLLAQTAGREHSILFDLTLWKTITPDSGLAVTKQMAHSGALISVSMPLPAINGYDLKIHREHNGIVDPIPQNHGSRNNDGEYWELKAGRIILHIKKFSLFSLTYQAYSGDTALSRIEDARPGGIVTYNSIDGTVPAYIIEALNNKRDISLVISWDGKKVVITPGKIKVTGQTSFSFTELTNLLADHPKLNKTDHVVFICGRDTGVFAPKDNLTRAEAATIFAKLTIGFDQEAKYKCTFSDVNSNAWYAKYVGFLQETGTSFGYPDGTFKPNDPISRAEFVSLASIYESETVDSAGSFSDIPTTHWAYKQIEYARNRKWISGYPGGNFEPDKNIIRAEAVTLVCRILEREINAQSTNGNAIKVFPDVPRDYWAFYDIVESASPHDFTITEGRELWKK